MMQKVTGADARAALRTRSRRGEAQLEEKHSVVGNRSPINALGIDCLSGISAGARRRATNQVGWGCDEISSQPNAVDIALRSSLFESTCAVIVACTRRERDRRRARGLQEAVSMDYLPDRSSCTPAPASAWLAWQPVPRTGAPLDRLL